MEACLAAVAVLAIIASVWSLVLSCRALNCCAQVSVSQVVLCLYSSFLCFHKYGGKVSSFACIDGYVCIVLNSPYKQLTIVCNFPFKKQSTFEIDHWQPRRVWVVRKWQRVGGGTAGGREQTCFHYSSLFYSFNKVCGGHVKVNVQWGKMWSVFDPSPPRPAIVFHCQSYTCMICAEPTICSE